MGVPLLLLPSAPELDMKLCGTEGRLSLFLLPLSLPMPLSLHLDMHPGPAPEWKPVLQLDKSLLMLPTPLLDVGLEQGDETLLYRLGKQLLVRGPSIPGSPGYRPSKEGMLRASLPRMRWIWIELGTGTSTELAGYRSATG